MDELLMAKIPQIPGLPKTPEPAAPKSSPQPINEDRKQILRGMAIAGSLVGYAGADFVVDPTDQRHSTKVLQEMESEGIVRCFYGLDEVEMAYSQAIAKATEVTDNTDDEGTVGNGPSKFIRWKRAREF
jgi:hypothetical protein